MNFRILLLLMGLTTILGCRMNYEHKIFERQSDPLIVEGLTVKPNLVGTGIGSVGNRTGSPWRLKLVVESVSEDTSLRIIEASIRDDGTTYDLNSEVNQVYVFETYSDGLPTEVNVTLDESAALTFKESKKVELLLVIEITKQRTKRTIEHTFVFEGKLIKGKERFNPLTDIT